MTHPPRAGGNAGSAPGQRRRDVATPEANDEIAKRLRALYAEVEQEPIPAALIDLLERLDAAEEDQKAAQKP
jgi:hypothetical protein